MKMNLFFSTDNNGVEMCLTAIYSVVKNNTGRRIAVYILDSDITPSNKHYFNTLAEHFTNLKIRFIEINDTEFKRLKMPRKDLSLQAYFRYLIPDLLPKENKALYLDIDLLCLGPIDYLYETDIESYHVAGVEDYDVMHVPELSGVRKLASDKYLNSGVILMNLQKIRADGLVTEFFKNAGPKRSKLIPKQLDIFVDQTVFNLTFPKKKYLSPAYNLLLKTAEDITIKPTILHFSGFFKPFSYDASGSGKVVKYMSLYKEYYFETMDLVVKRDYTLIVDTIRKQYSQQIASAQVVIAQQNRHIEHIEGALKSSQDQTETLQAQVEYLKSTKGIIKTLARRIRQKIVR